MLHCPRFLRLLRSAVPGCLSALLALSVAACGSGTPPADVTTASPDGIICAPDNGGLTLPDGFCAVVVADSIGRARHLAVRDNGDVYVMLSRWVDGAGIVALRDTTGDGRADVVERFGDLSGTGIGLRNGYLYAASDTAVYRYALPAGAFVPTGEREQIVGGFPPPVGHSAKPLTLDDAGNLYVTVGSPSNTCQENDRALRSPGLDPCPELERYAGIWRFSADTPGQTQADGQRYATGIRNAVAITWHDGALYAAQHGRDQLNNNWPDLFTEEQNAELPAEEFLRVTEGADFGWPYCYYDPVQGKKVLAPEYGGNGQEVGRCADVPEPLVAFPGHWAPNAVAFYTGNQFAERYRGGAFIAFHGSWNRAPLPQQGYQVAFVPFANGQPSGNYETFADGFKGTETLASPGDARFRPTGLAVGPDGSLYIADSVQGRIWRVVYTGR